MPDPPGVRVRVGSGLHLMVRAHALCDDCTDMTTTSSPTAAPTPARDVRRVYRDSQEPVIGGVAGGLARHLAVPVIWVPTA